jgi:hypothetical protein
MESHLLLATNKEELSFLRDASFLDCINLLREHFHYHMAAIVTKCLHGVPQSLQKYDGELGHLRLRQLANSQYFRITRFLDFAQSRKYKTQRFGNWICFRRQVRRESLDD